jgi:hypothetical protein
MTGLISHSLPRGFSHCIRSNSPVIPSPPHIRSNEWPHTPKPHRSVRPSSPISPSPLLEVQRPFASHRRASSIQPRPPSSLSVRSCLSFGREHEPRWVAFVSRPTYPREYSRPITKRRAARVAGRQQLPLVRCGDPAGDVMLCLVSKLNTWVGKELSSGAWGAVYAM